MEHQNIGYFDSDSNAAAATDDGHDEEDDDEEEDDEADLPRRSPCSAAAPAVSEKEERCRAARTCRRSSLNAALSHIRG